MRLFTTSHVFRSLRTRCVMLLVLAGSAGLASAALAAPIRPNLVFILADDLGWRDTTPYGSRFHETPNIQRLAARGLRFTNAYAANPLCSPTRASILTGLYPARIGITLPACHEQRVQLEKKLAPAEPRQRAINADSLTRLKPEYVTLAEELKAAGYATAHFGKWHLGHSGPYEPKDQGFDLDFPHTPNVPGPGPSYIAPWKFIHENDIVGKPGEHIEDRMSAEAAKYIHAHKDQPFYLNYWAYSVHSPWNAKTDLIEHFAKKVDPSDPQHNPLYAAMVKTLDDAVGRLLEAIDSAGIADRTIIVFFSDNGGFSYLPTKTDPPGYDDVPATSNLPLRSGKASLYEGGTREPCMVIWPGKTKAGGVSDALLSSIDWKPTLLEMLGVRPQAGVPIDGVSQVRTLLGQGQVRDTIYCHFPHGGDAQAAQIPGSYPGTYVRRGDWKLIRFYCANDDGSDRLELYNLKEDVGETRNLASGNAALVQELNGLITQFLKETEAVVPIRNPDFNAATLPRAGWHPSRDCGLVLRNGTMVMTSTGGDPGMTTTLRKPLPAAPMVLELTMSSTSKGQGQFFWAEEGVTPPFFRDRSKFFPVQHDGQLHDYRVEFTPAHAIKQVRFDPTMAPGEIVIKTMRLKDGAGKVLVEWTFDAVW